MKHNSTYDLLHPKAFTPRIVNDKAFEELQHHSNGAAQHLINQKPCTNVLADSCEIIFKSREDILGIKKEIPLHTARGKSTFMAVTRNSSYHKKTHANESSFHKLKRKVEFCEEYKEKIDKKGITYKKITSRNNNIHKALDFNEQLSAKEISEGVMYGYGGIGYKEFKANSKNVLLGKLKKEILERKLRMYQYQQKIMRTLETRRDNSFEEDKLYGQVCTQPVKDINGSYNSLQLRIKTKPDTGRRFDMTRNYRAITTVAGENLQDFDSDKEGMARKPYVGKRTNKKDNIQYPQHKVNK